MDYPISNVLLRFMVTFYIFDLTEDKMVFG